MKFNSLKDVTECLLDEERVKGFQRAISRVVRLSDTVVDCGTGTGILAILVAKEGAKRVTAIERDRKVYDLACENVANSGAEVVVVHGDAAACCVNADVVITEMLDTLLITGEQAKVTNALVNRGVVAGRTRVIPLKISNFFEPVSYDYEFFDCHLPMVVQGRNASQRCLDVLGQAVLFHEVFFNAKIALRVHHEGSHLIHTKGWLNALKFSTVVHLTDDLMLGDSVCAPIYVPVHQMFVKPGDVVSVQIVYTMGGGYESLKVNVC